MGAIYTEDALCIHVLHTSTNISSQQFLVDIWQQTNRLITYIATVCNHTG